MNKESLWSSVLAELELSVSPGNFTTWILPLSALSLKSVSNNKKILKIGCPSIFHKNQVGERYVGQIQEVLEKVLKTKCEVGLEIKSVESDSRNDLSDAKDLFSVDTKQLAQEAAYHLAMLRRTQHNAVINYIESP